MNLEKHRSKTNTIFKLNRPNADGCVTTCDGILSEVASHFSTLYRSNDEDASYKSNSDHIFLKKEGSIKGGNEEQWILDQSISEKEVLNALKKVKKWIISRFRWTSVLSSSGMI